MIVVELVGDIIIVFFKTTVALNSISSLMKYSFGNKNCGAHKCKHFFASGILMM